MEQSPPLEIIFWLAICSPGLASCDVLSQTARAGESGEPTEAAEPAGDDRDFVGAPEHQRLDPATIEDQYPWRAPEGGWPSAAPLDAYVRPPSGFERVEVEPDSFASFLRRLPVRLDQRGVHSHRGEPLAAPAAGVIALPLVEGDLQQCADSIVRLRAEYLWSAGRRDAIGFHFTSGDLSSWTDWAAGERFEISGSDVDRVQGARRDDSRRNFRAYLQHLFRYAGTRSLPHDARRLESSEPTRPGDFFLDPGSPGHAVLVLDVARNEAGSRLALLGQGFMPAQEFHLVEGTGSNVAGGVWFELPATEGGTVKTPSWDPFGRDDRWRFD